MPYVIYNNTPHFNFLALRIVLSITLISCDILE